MLLLIASSSQKTHVFCLQDRKEDCEELLRIEEDANWQTEGM